MDNVFVLGIILIIILCIVIVLNSKTRQKFFSESNNCDNELRWNHEHEENKPVVRNGVNFYKISHCYKNQQLFSQIQ